MLRIIECHKSLNQEASTVCPRRSYPFYIVTHYINGYLLFGHIVCRQTKHLHAKRPFIDEKYSNMYISNFCSPFTNLGSKRNLASLFGINNQFKFLDLRKRFDPSPPKKIPLSLFYYCCAPEIRDFLSIDL